MNNNTHTTYEDASGQYEPRGQDKQEDAEVAVGEAEYVPAGQATCAADEVQ